MASADYPQYSQSNTPSDMFGGIGQFLRGRQMFNPYGQGGGFNPYMMGGGGFNPYMMGGGGFNPYMMGGGGFNPYMAGIGRYAPQQQIFNPYNQMSQDQQFYASLDPRAIAANPRGFQNMMQQRQQSQFQSRYSMPQIAAPQPAAPRMGRVESTPEFEAWFKQKEEALGQTPEKQRLEEAQAPYEAFKRANPNPFSYSEFAGGNPALRQQYLNLYGPYKEAFDAFYKKGLEYDTTNPYPGIGSQPATGDVTPTATAGNDVIYGGVAGLGKFGGYGGGSRNGIF